MKVIDDEKAVRCYNYPYEAIEEILANSVFHKSWNDRNPIEVSINHNSIEVLNFEGPLPPISNADLKKRRLVSRYYRNRCIGDFLKEMHMTEGRSTGFPKIYQAIKRNDSPLPIFETDERNTHFLAIVPIHRAFIDEKVYLSSIGKKIDEEIDEDFIKNFIKDFTKEVCIELSERQINILNIIAKDASVTSEKISKKISKKNPVTTRTIANDIAYLKKIGILTREGGRKDGYWVIRQHLKE